MYDLEKIQELFGSDDLQYLRNKNRGGSSNQKGNTYENFFVVYQIALLAQEVIENCCTATLFCQVIAFVDDLVIDNKDDNPLKHYQLKNSTNVSCESRPRSISDDFRKQYQLNQSISRASELHLVVPCCNLRTRLDANCPHEIRPYSIVVYFPYEHDLRRTVLQCAGFRAAIEYLSAFENPAPDKIECVALLLLGAWESGNKSNVSVPDILKKAQAHNPSYIRSLRVDHQIDPQVAEILGKIPGFTYNLTKGFLHWQYGGLEKGTLRYSMDTDSFARFQALIKNCKPSTFEELESFLL